MKKLSSSGFGFVPVVVLLVLVGLLVFAGLRVNDSSKEDNQASQVKTLENTDSKLKTTQDIESTTKDLDTVDIEKDLETTDLDNDINSVL